MTAFVILHYRAIDSTIKCTESIKALEGDNQIVIVDNKSPDDTAERLIERYKNDPQVKVLLNPENAGFARGNNFGIKYVRENMNADFICVLNDDVEVLQKDFCLKISEIYAEKPFDVLGPDIVSVFSGIHQSPKRMKGFDLNSLRRKMEYVEKSSKPVRMLLSSGQKNNRYIWRGVQRHARAKQHIDSTVCHENIILHGACVIFSSSYIESHPEPFYPKTFMYFEMEILDWLCRQEGNVVLYDPRISVKHYQYMATTLEYRSIIKRSRFVLNCLSDSLVEAEKLMLSAEKNSCAETAAVN